ncbi:MAG TPA: FliA/WhiG family RNA polymerase sigma factor, partial [Candidatus Acidoferrum sp.]|nr:FliA/WhiG family RNA polymerase sigma factor [Candidatus Acidoferrum sp.]
MTDELLALWRRFRAGRDPDLRDALIRQYISLVRKVAGRLSMRLPPHVDLDDLEAAGVPGLLAAVETYDPEKDVEFAAYAQLRIRGAILDELRSLDPLPRSIREKARQIERAVAALEQKLLRSPTDDEVAEQLLIPLEVYHQILYELRGGLHVSLDSGWGNGQDEEDGEGGVPTVPEGRAPNPWQALALKERQKILGAVIEELPRSERTVLSLYYYEELTMKEIGAVLEVSESRVSQIHSAALVRIRSRLHRRRLQPEDL